MVRVRVALAVVLTLMVGACGGGTGATTTGAPTTAATTTTAPTTTTTPPGFEVVSDDGDLTVEVPFAAMASDPGITIRLLAPEEYPPELAGVADDPEARIYNLEPEGLVFAAPVRVTRRIDAARFGEMTPTMVPIVALITRQPDGTYEAYGDQRVTRNGDDVFVSGTTTHFSPSIAVNLGQYAEMTLDDHHLGFKAEMGTSLQIGYKWYDSAFTPLEAPVTYEPVGFSRSAAFQFGTADAMLDVSCSKIGQAMPRMGVKVTLDSAAPEGQVGLRTLPAFMPSLAVFETTLKIAQEFYCLDPATSFLVALAVLSFTIATDHPGGQVYIPDEDFRGGLSGSKVAFPYLARLEGAWAGLIEDNNGNGLLDSSDSIYAPWSLERNGDFLEYVAPLYGYGSYFVYVADASQFSGPPAGQEWGLTEGMQAFLSCYTGVGRFETSIGVLGTKTGLFEYQVGPQETETTVEDGSVQQMVFRTTFQF